MRLMNCYWSKTEILWKYFMHRVTRNLSVLQSLQFVQSVAGKPFLALRWVFSQHTCKGTKTVLDSGFQAADFGSQVLDSRQCQWSLDSEFQALVIFRIAQANFSHRERVKKFPDSGIRISVPGATWGKVLLRLQSQSICTNTYRSHLILSYLYRSSLDFECKLK